MLHYTWFITLQLKRIRKGNQKMNQTEISKKIASKEIEQGKKQASAAMIGAAETLERFAKDLRARASVDSVTTGNISSSILDITANIIGNCRVNEMAYDLSRIESAKAVLQAISEIENQ